MSLASFQRLRFFPDRAVHNRLVFDPGARVSSLLLRRRQRAYRTSADLIKSRAEANICLRLFYLFNSEAVTSPAPSNAFRLIRPVSRGTRRRPARGRIRTTDAPSPHLGPMVIWLC